MFSKFGAAGTFFAFFVAGGKHEVKDLFDLIIGDRNTTLVHNREAEIIGRAMSLALQYFIVLLCGALLYPRLESGVRSDDLQIQRASQFLMAAWFCMIMLAVCRYNGKLWHTTTLTRRCVRLVGGFYSDGSKIRIE